MKYSEDLTGQEYFDNFKCCKNCPSWQVDHTLRGDYAYNGCKDWAEKGLSGLTPWAAFCDYYSGTKTNEGPYHKMTRVGDKLVFQSKKGAETT